jgi:hypothetical protein
VDLLVSTISGNAPRPGIPGDCGLGAIRKGEIGAVPSATTALAVTTLAMVFDDRLVSDFIPDGSASASADISPGHHSFSSDVIRPVGFVVRQIRRGREIL